MITRIEHLSSHCLRYLYRAPIAFDITYAAVSPLR
jgi:hypothetical protein